MLWRKHFEIILVCCFLIIVSCCDLNRSSKNPSDLSFWRVGSESGIKNRFGTNCFEVLDDLTKQKKEFNRFLLAIAEQPLTDKQILNTSELTKSQVEYFISKLESIQLIKKDDPGRWVPTIPVITDNQMKLIRTDLSLMASSVAQYLREETQQLKIHYDSVKTPLDPPWEIVTHLIIDKLIIDGSFHSKIIQLERERNARESESQQQSVTPAFFLEQGINFSNFGTNWYQFNKDDDQIEVYVLHGAIMDRYSIAMNKYRGDKPFSTGLFKISPEGGINSLTDQEKAMLRYLNWIENDRLLVPIVEATTVKSLFPLIDKIGAAAAEVAFGHFDDILVSSDKSPYSEFLDNDHDYIQVCYHALFGIIIEQLVENGVVSPVPEPVPDSFGVYFVFGKLF